MAKNDVTSKSIVAVSENTLSSLNAESTRQLTDKIKHDLNGVGANLQRIKESRAYELLNYKTWKDYVETEFPFNVRESYYLMSGAKPKTVTKIVTGVRKLRVDNNFRNVEAKDNETNDSTTAQHESPVTPPQVASPESPLSVTAPQSDASQNNPITNSTASDSDTAQVVAPATLQTPRTVEIVDREIETTQSEINDLNAKLNPIVKRLAKLLDERHRLKYPTGDLGTPVSVAVIVEPATGLHYGSEVWFEGFKWKIRSLEANNELANLQRMQGATNLTRNRVSIEALQAV